MAAIQRQDDEYANRRKNNGTAEKSYNSDDYSTLYGSDTEEDECIKDLEDDIKSAEKKINRKNVDDYKIALNKLENYCKNLFSNFKTTF